MNTTKLIAAATTAAVLATAGVSIAGAASGGSTTVPSASASANGSARAGVLKQARKDAFNLAAKTIGIKPAQLLKELQGGHSIADVATAHNVQPQAVIDAIVQGANQKIDAAKTAGKITDEQATKAKAKAPDLASKFVNADRNGIPKAARQAIRKRVGADAVKVAAKTIGVKPAALAKEIKAGHTVASVATAHNVQPQAVIDALVQSATQKIEALKTAGTITADQATKLEAKAPTVAANFVNNVHGK